MPTTLRVSTFDALTLGAAVKMERLSLSHPHLHGSRLLEWTASQVRTSFTPADAHNTTRVGYSCLFLHRRCILASFFLFIYLCHCS